MSGTSRGIREGSAGARPDPGATERPLVSVITVVYNGAKTIEQTIASVANQSYPNVEYIIIDGGSTDGTLEIIKGYAASIDAWVSRSDSGMYYAMNEGLARGTGELIGIINGDDWYERDAIEIAVREFLASDRHTVIYGITRYYDERGRDLDMILSYDHRKLPTRMINHPACFIPKTLYQRFGTFDTTYRVAADYDLLLRFYRHGVPFRHVESILANFRHGGFSAQNQSAKEALHIRRQHGYINQPQYLVGNGLRIARSVIGGVIRALR
jgi:glycosyltransferase involved in cell wall biosynthesis